MRSVKGRYILGIVKGVLRTSMMHATEFIDFSFFLVKNTTLCAFSFRKCRLSTLLLFHSSCCFISYVAPGRSYPGVLFYVLRFLAASLILCFPYGRHHHTNRSLQPCMNLSVCLLSCCLRHISQVASLSEASRLEIYIIYRGLFATYCCSAVVEPIIQQQ